MAPPLLVLRNRSGAGLGVFRYQGATPTQVGNDFGTIENYQTADTPRDRVVFFQGDLYALGNAGVYKKDDPTVMTGNWTIDVTFTTPDAVASQRRTGLYPMTVNGVQSLVGLYGTSSAGQNDWRAVIYNGTTGLWTETAEVANIGSSTTEFKSACVFGDVLHLKGITGRIFTYDPASNVMTALAFPFGNDSHGDFCTFNNRLFLVETGNTDLRLLEFVGGSWVVAVTFDTDGDNTVIQNSNCALFEDGTNMFAFVVSDQFNASHGTRVWQFDAALTPTNITSTVLPANLISTGDGGSYGGTIDNARWLVYSDQDTTPGQQDHWLYFAGQASAGTTFSLYKWNGNATLIGNSGVADDTGGDVAHAIPSHSYAGGERAWTVGQMSIWPVTPPDAELGGERYKFKAGGAGGAADKNVQVRYTREQEADLAIVPLVAGSATGGSASVNGNTVENVDADGTTEYSVLLDWAAVGVNPNDRVKTSLFISI